MSQPNETSNEIDDLRREMAKVRKELHEDVAGVVENAKELTDWRSYLRDFPVASLAIAAAAGFLVVPNKVNVMSPSEGQLRHLAKKNRLVVKPKPTTDDPAPGWQKRALNFAANMAVRGAIAYVGQQVGKQFGHVAADDNSKEFADVS